MTLTLSRRGGLEGLQQSREDTIEKMPAKNRKQEKTKTKKKGEKEKKRKEKEKREEREREREKRAKGSKVEVK